MCVVVAIVAMVAGCGADAPTSTGTGTGTRDCRGIYHGVDATFASVAGTIEEKFEVWKYIRKSY
jgi:hypothetical protein